MQREDNPNKARLMFPRYHSFLGSLGLLLSSKRVNDNEDEEGQSGEENKDGGIDADKDGFEFSDEDDHNKSPPKLGSGVTLTLLKSISEGETVHPDGHIENNSGDTISKVIKLNEGSPETDK